MIRYKLDQGRYYLIDTENPDRILYGYDEISFLYTENEEGMWTMHKHGSIDNVKKEFKKYLEAYKKYDFIGEPKIISGKFPIEEINKVIEISGYIKTFIQNLMYYKCNDCNEHFNIPIRQSHGFISIIVCPKCSSKNIVKK